MKRSSRIVGITNHFIQKPKHLFQLTYFSERYNASKSSISEDLTIVDEMFKHEEIGYLHRISGAAGGVQFVPSLSREKSIPLIKDMCEKLEDPNRILPGGYLYMSDLLGNPDIVRQVGQLFATTFAERNIDVVMTVETKGIPLAYAVAAHLHVPVIIVRRDPKVTEGSSVSINYVSGSSRRIQTMVLPRRSLTEGMKVCIVDDFMKAGGTINGMISLLDEFSANVAAIGVLAEADDEEDDRIVEDYISLIKIKNVNMQNHTIDVSPGNFLTKMGEN